MDLNRMILGVLGLFSLTIVVFAGDPIMHGELYEMCLEADHDIVCNNLLNGWNLVIPVLIIVCFYLIVTGGRTEDHPSQYYGGP